MSPGRKTQNNELGSVLGKLKSDRYSNFLGIQITKIERGYAQANLTVAERMLNFNGFAHGGLIFSLAMQHLQLLVTHRSDGSRIVVPHRVPTASPS
jgi:acyl-coenzyme A thioesterase PaaI-like protein